MKRLFISILSIAVATIVTEARQRTLAEMQAAAAQAITSAGNLSNQGARTLTAPKVLQNDTQLTLLGYENGGFAVIANDDAFSPVLGYATGTHLSATHAPGFIWWMEAMNRSLEAKLMNGTTETPVPHSESERKAVGPLLTTQWGQDAPFNNLCPEYTDKNNTTKKYITGCVATSMAQVMNYHKYPAKGTGSYTHRFNNGNGTITLRADFGSTSYDWTNMLDAYTNGQYTNAEAEAVATLMLHCGIATRMQYNEEGSGTQSYKARNALKTYFGYHPNIKCIMREYFHVEEWMQIIYRELNDGCPIIYGGTTQAGAGHSFVLDGYDENGLVSVNWGWNGSDNGYFDIASLNGFSENQDMVIVRTADDDRYTDTAQSLWGMRDPLSISVSGTSLTLKANALYNFYEIDFLDGFSGKVDLVAENLSTGEITTLATVDDEIFDMKFGTGFETRPINNIPTNGLSNGEYRIYMASMPETEDDSWQPVRSKEGTCNSYLLTKSGNNIELKTELSSAWTDVKNIKTAETNAISTGVYTLDGRYAGKNLNDMPKGIYIYNGQKVTK